MRRLILFFSVIHLVCCSCPDGFELVRDGECRGLLDTEQLPFDQAISLVASKCAEIQGQAVIIHNEEQQEYWKGRADPQLHTYLLLGLVCNISSHKWEWTDGSAMDYMPPQYYEDLKNECKTGRSWYMKSTGYWDDGWTTEKRPFDIFCTTQLPQLPVPSADGCEFFEDDSDDGVCYQIGATPENWQDAQLICRKLDANLASIHNQQENSFIRRLAVSRGNIYGVYLGATLSGKGQDFGWVDGSEWDYDNFYPGFPKAGFGQCVALDTSTPTGQWKNIDCDAKIPVACIREQRNVEEPTCSSEPWKEGMLITSPGFPLSASTPCDFYLTADKGKKVEVEIVFLEANSCCDSLIVYDGYFGGVVMANLTGELTNATFTTTASNIMQVSWAPNGGVNVRGMAMTFRGV